MNAPETTPTNMTPWWRHAVIYQVYIRSFADSDGDGIGDLGGIRSRLPYLSDLGVDAIWITPFYVSPMADGGYDVADYRNVDLLFGNLADAEALFREAHQLGLRVIVDIVPNHSSDQHEWFQAALASDPGSPERERYIFHPGRGPAGEQAPTDWESAFGGSAWKRLPDGEWFLHLCAPEQPDLNWENPEVIEDFHATLRFWLDRGVDGFRVDMANALKKDQSFPDLGAIEQRDVTGAEGPHHPFSDRDEVHEIYRGWRRVLDEYDGERAFVAETVRSPTRLARYLQPDELHSAFNFEYLEAPWDAMALRQVIDQCLTSTQAVGAPTTWVLSSHDVIRHATRYGQLNRSHATISEGQLRTPVTTAGSGALGLRRARAATLLTLALPGSAYIYQGEELGLPEVLDLPEGALEDPIWLRSLHTERGRDGCRVPIPWTIEGPSLGFGSGVPWLPQPQSWDALSVQAQRGSPGSVLEFYRAALSLRRREPALRDAPLEWLSSPVDTLVFQRVDEKSKATIVCAVNLSSLPAPLSMYGELQLASGPIGPGDELPPDTSAWLRR